MLNFTVRVSMLPKFFACNVTSQDGHLEGVKINMDTLRNLKHVHVDVFSGSRARETYSTHIFINMDIQHGHPGTNVHVGKFNKRSQTP